MKDFISVWFTYCELIYTHKEIQDIVESQIRITKEIQVHGHYKFGLSEGLDECSSFPLSKLNRCRMECKMVEMVHRDISPEFHNLQTYSIKYEKSRFQ